MNLSIREWRIGDKTALAQNLNNPKVLNNLRDGLPYPYTEKDAEVMKTSIQAVSGIIRTKHRYKVVNRRENVDC